MKTTIDAIDKYLKLQTQPNLFSQPIKPILNKNKLVYSEVKPRQLKASPNTHCVYCQNPSLPFTKFCAHHFPASCKLARCAFNNCSEPALLGCYRDAVGVSYCNLHKGAQDLIQKSHPAGEKFLNEEIKELPDVAYGSHIDVQIVNVDREYCENVIDQILSQILTCMAVYE